MVVGGRWRDADSTGNLPQAERSGTSLLQQVACGAQKCVAQVAVMVCARRWRPLPGHRRSFVIGGTRIAGGAVSLEEHRDWRSFVIGGGAFAGKRASLKKLPWGRERVTPPFPRLPGRQAFSGTHLYTVRTWK